MTASARARRNFRHLHESRVMLKFSQTRAGQFATIPQVKAAARQALMQLTSAFRVAEIRAAATA